MPLFLALLITGLLTAPLATAKSGSRTRAKASAIRPLSKVTLIKPALLRPRAADFGVAPAYPQKPNAALGNYVYPVAKTDTGLPIYSSANTPSYLAQFNSGIPCYNNGQSGGGGFSILKYTAQCNQPGQPIHLWDPNQANAANNPMGGMGGGGPGGGGGMPGGFPGGGGSPYGNNNGGGYQTASLSNNTEYQGSGGPGPSLTGKALFAGTCQSENAGDFQNTSGYCQTIYETLKDDSCAKNALSELAKSSPPTGMGAFCSQYNQIKTSTESHIQFWQNLVASLVMEESSWNPNVAPSDGGNSHGLLSLSPADAKIYGCSCAGLNVNDPHSNLRCGTWVVLKNLLRDRNMGAGYAPHGVGIARYFGPFTDGQTSKRNRIAQKTQNWCTTHAPGAPGAAPTTVADANPPPAKK